MESGRPEPAAALVSGASFVLLEVYCVSVVAMRAHRAVMLAAVEGSPRYVEASRFYERECAMILKIGKQLRLGPRHDRTKLRAVSTLPRPWDIGAAGPAAPEPFKGFGWTPPDGAA